MFNSNGVNKKILYSIAGLVVLGLIGWGLAVKIKPKNQMVVSNPNLTAEQNQEFNDKISKLMAIVNDPNSSKANVTGAWLGIGVYYETLGQRDKELAAFLKAAETDPKSYLPWSNLATFYVDAKQYDKAAEAFQKALSLPGGSADPQLWLKWVNFNIYQISSDDKHIRMIFNDAYAATNNNNLLLRQGASYLEMTGDIPGAIAAWQAVLKESPTDQTVQATIAALQAKLKK